MGQSFRKLYDFSFEWLYALLRKTYPKTQVATQLLTSHDEKQFVESADNGIQSIPMSKSLSSSEEHELNWTAVEKRLEARKRREGSPMWPTPPPNNLSLALANIISSGINDPISQLTIESVDLLLFGFPWKASNPIYQSHPLMTEITSKWQKSLPNLYPIFDNFEWETRDPTPFTYIMVLFGTPSGYYFFHHWEIMAVGSDLTVFLEEMCQNKLYNTEEEGRWEEILDDEEAEAISENAKKGIVVRDLWDSSLVLVDAPTDTSTLGYDGKPLKDVRVLLQEGAPRQI